ncbi:MAG TPA: host-nuclease inhibitor Gam family protein [Verrucomicrobiae bacterium]
MKAKKIQLPQTEEFQSLINLLAVYSEATNQLSNLQSVANDHLMEVLDDLRPQYAELQGKLLEAESAMEIIARKHPEWFNDKKTIKTPYGAISLKSSTALDVSNEEAVLVRIELEAQRRFPAPAQKAERDEFIAKFVRSEQRLNKEALEGEEDAFLKQLGVARVQKQNFSAKPAALDMGKAVSETNAEEQQVAAAA